METDYLGNHDMDGQIILKIYLSKIGYEAMS
jgi:hypothetical protein